MSEQKSIELTKEQLEKAAAREKEGFATGEMLQWKLFDAGSGEVHDLQVEYDPQFPDNDGTFSPFGLSAITDIQHEAEPCPLPAGWEKGKASP